MGDDLENLSNELVQAQLLLCADDDQIGQLLQEISRIKLRDGVNGGISAPSVVYAPEALEKEAGIRTMLERLEKLG